jgi:hypothetical protein
MSKTNSTPRSPGPASRARSLHPSTLVAAVVVLLLLPVTWCAGRNWLELSRKQASLETELHTLTAKNAVLERAYDALPLQKFQVCNKSKDSLTIPWMAAVYHDGKQLRVFDSLRCRGWREHDVNAGESKVFNYSSTEEGCNWNGAVAFYAFHMVRESEEGVHAYNVAGPWRGFDRDCFTVE